MDHSAKIKISKQKGIAYKKIIGIDKSYKRSKVKISENKNCVYIYIDAKDITALRASTNAILRGFQVIGTLQQFRKTKIKVKIYKYKSLSMYPYQSFYCPKILDFQVLEF